MFKVDVYVNENFITTVYPPDTIHDESEAADWAMENIGIDLDIEEID